MTSTSSIRALAFVALAAFLTLRPTAARADAGAVDLTDGTRLSGTVIEVVPNDHVLVLLADGRTARIAWAGVVTVYDGPRVYDAQGNVTSSTQGEGAGSLAPPAPPPGGTAPMPPTGYGAPPPSTYPYPSYAAAGAPYRPLESDPAAWQRYQMMPRRPGTICMLVFGPLLLLDGIGLFGSGTDRAVGSSDRTSYFTAGAIMTGIGGLLLGFGIRRAHQRRSTIRDLRSQGFYVAGLDAGLALRFDVAPGRVVPTVGLRF